jgi:hypothetical protein
MKVSFVLFSLLFATNVLAQGAAVPHQFSNGNAIVASEFNANFQNLANRNNGTQAQVAQNAAAIASVQTTLNANFQDLANRNNGTQAQVTQNAAAIASVQTTLSSVERTIDQIQAHLANLQTGGGNPLLQFVGNSTGTIDGAQGLRTMTELCQADFPASRMCTTEEYAKTYVLPQPIPDTTYAWLAATNLSWTPTGRVRDRFATSITDNSEPQLTCTNWSFNSFDSRGLSVSGIGKFGKSTCEIPLPVSCCQ